MRFCKIFLMVGVASAGFVFTAAAQLAHLDWKLTTVGQVRQVITNMGTLNKALTRFPGLANCEYPPGSTEEHLYQGGIWIGALTPGGDTLVSETQNHFSPNEFYPTSASWDTVWVGSKGDTLQIPYWPNYVAVSDQDFVCRYSDDNLLNISDHTPLNLDIIQTSYSWGSGQLDAFLLHTYYIVPKKIPLKNAYIAFWMHGSTGTYNCGDNFIDEYTHYFPQYHMIVDEDSPGFCDGQAMSPVAFAVMSPTDSSLKWTFKYYEHETLPLRDPAEYIEMSSGTIMQDRLDPARAHEIVSFGPLQINVGDTVKVVMAEVLGKGMSGMLSNVAYLQFLKSKNFRVPSAPPRPVLTVVTGSHQVHLDWHVQPGGVNPEIYTDPYRGDTISRPFEGYRLYKSTKSPEGPWNLLADFDVKGDGEGFETGLQYAYTDDGLLNNIEYYYTLTSYSRADKVINFPAQESSLSYNVKKAVPGPAPPASVGEVTVVPNPYRGDIAYNSYNPPWEKAPQQGQLWMEQYRKIQFTNLPPQCEIKIFTLAGDLVETIRHQSPTQGYENWNLTSHVGQAVASGLYLFTCEDLANGRVQVGKFVIIK